MKKPSFKESAVGSVNLNKVKEETVEQEDEEVSDDGAHFELVERKVIQAPKPP